MSNENGDVIDSVMFYMNKAEQCIKRHDGTGECKRQFVVDSVQRFFPHWDEEFIVNTIEIIITLSKSSIPLLINKSSKKTCFNCWK